jgi:DNA (cytosine-5)-methyltransferase 1
MGTQQLILYEQPRFVLPESERAHLQGGGPLRSLEICAGAGGQALGLEQAGFQHVALVEVDEDACETLRRNRPHWNVLCADVRSIDARAFQGIDLLAGGVPCPPFSIAGKQLGTEDERDLFPQVIRLASECTPRAIMIENVRGILSSRFLDYRRAVCHALRALGYVTAWELVNSCDYGVPQLRPRAVLVAVRADTGARFVWPVGRKQSTNVGDALHDMMASEGWPGADRWRRHAQSIAPTIVGGSKKHGGPDLGPTRARRDWAALGVDGLGIADNPPGPSFEGNPRLTIPMVARIQGFPDDWAFAGRKTSAYRQVGNAFPPPVARAIGLAIAACLGAADRVALHQASSGHPSA